MSAKVVDIDGQRKTFKFGPALCKRLEAQVASEERTEADIVRQAVKEYMDREDHKKALRAADIEAVRTGQIAIQ